MWTWLSCIKPEIDVFTSNGPVEELRRLTNNRHIMHIIGQCYETASTAVNSAPVSFVVMYPIMKTSLLCARAPHAELMLWMLKMNPADAVTVTWWRHRRIPLSLERGRLCVAGIVLLRKRGEAVGEHPTLRSPHVPILAENQQRGEEQTPRKIWHGVSDITALNDTEKENVVVFLSSGGCVCHGHIMLLGWTDEYLRELVLESDGCACCVIAHAMPSAGSVFFCLC